MRTRLLRTVLLASSLVCLASYGAAAADMPKELTDAGKYFAEHKNLDGYKEKK